MRITYRELVTEDGELMVTAADEEAVQPAFDTPVKNYRIVDGMGVTFHCRMGGNPLPKVKTMKRHTDTPTAHVGLKAVFTAGGSTP